VEGGEPLVTERESMNNVIQFPDRPNNPEPPEHPVRVADRTIIMLNAVQERGMTWRDVAKVNSMNHGQASGLLSRLHQRNLIARLSEVREGCKVYVALEWVQDRPTERPTHSGDNTLLADMAAMLRTIPTRCLHIEWHHKCRSCEIRSLLYRYDER
jgi:hypothetical protein